ncbi:hypothetical protein ACFVYJ_03215 [Pontibacter sp. JAM-7]|uniref:hypothetical protein n=1 Tax=Pontibacter sp. JAM-7 TaxID=3366581 RepID=UPI003AF66AA0
MKKNLIILLIAASVGLTWYITQTTPRLTPEAKSQIENILLQRPEFPARPVWWSDDSILAIGVLPDTDVEQAAMLACRMLREQGVTTTAVEIYDVLKIQQNKEWQKLAGNTCR